MEKTETLERYEEVELKHYRNQELRDLIETTFSEEGQRKVAWGTVRLLKELYPEIEKTIRGKLIHKQKQEIR